jgi:hypothetical protein
MPQKLTTQEVAEVIRVRKIIKDRGFDKDVDIQTICQAAGISRKTGYQHANKLVESSNAQEQSHKELEKLRAEHEILKKRFDDVRFENEGRKLAWEIHGIDKFLAEKKSSTVKKKRKKR